MLVSVNITKRPKTAESLQELKLFPRKNLLNLLLCLHLSHFFVSKNGNTEGTKKPNRIFLESEITVSLCFRNSFLGITLLFFSLGFPRFEERSHMFLLLGVPAYPKAAGKKSTKASGSWPVSKSHSFLCGPPPLPVPCGFSLLVS